MYLLLRIILPCLVLLCSYATTCIFDCSSEGSVDIETTINDDDVAETIDGPLEARNEPRSLINFNWTFLEAPQVPSYIFQEPLRIFAYYLGDLRCFIAFIIIEGLKIDLALSRTLLDCVANGWMCKKSNVLMNEINV